MVSGSVLDAGMKPDAISPSTDPRSDISTCGFDEIRENEDHAVIGSRFCDYLATILASHLRSAFDSAGLLEHMAYSKIMSSLERACKARIPGEDWQLIKASGSIMEILQKLGILEAPASIPRKRGRPKK